MQNQDQRVITNRLRDIRTPLRISQWQLALTSGVKQSRISLIENCLVKPNNNEKIKLASALGREIVDIFFDEQPVTKQT